MPGGVDEGAFLYVDSEETVTQMMDEIRPHKELAIDLEYHAYRSYMGFTCLMQLSTREKDYIIDTLALKDNL